MKLKMKIYGGSVEEYSDSIILVELILSVDYNNHRVSCVYR